MKPLILSTAALAVFLGSDAFSLAQTSSAGSAARADHSLRASKLLHGPVYNAAGEEIGTIDDILVSPSDGIARAIISVRKYIGRANAMVAVPLGRIQLDSGKLMMPQSTKESLAAMPRWTYESDLEGGGH